MRRGPMLYLSMALLSGLLLWAGWFALAYALHGAQCEGAVALMRGEDRVAQIAVWSAAFAATLVQSRWIMRMAKERDLPAQLLKTSRYLQFTAIGAILFMGIPLVMLAPC